MSRNRDQDKRPAPQRARAATGTYARPRRGPALGRGRRRAGSGRRARPAGRSLEPLSSTDPRVASAAASAAATGTLGTGCRGKPEGPGPCDPRFCKLCAGVRRPRGAGRERLGSPNPSWQASACTLRPAPPAPGNIWLSVMPSTQLERLSSVLDWCAQCSHMTLISPKYPCSGAKLNCAGLVGRRGSREV